MLLFLDIETIPAPPELHDVYLSTLKEPPAGAEERAEHIAETSLKGEFGRILCVGYWKEPDMKEPAVLTGDEPPMLRRFWEIARGVHKYVGHNIMEFDLPFLVKRSIIHRIKPLGNYSFQRYRHDTIFDTMHEWTQWSRDKIGLDTLAKVLGLRSSKGELDGSKVAAFHAAGRDEEIYAYCKDDVRLVREAYRRMTFEA